MISMCVSRAVLEQALADLNHAAEKGYEHCTAILNLVEAGDSLTDCVLGYERHIILKAHPTNGNYNWGNTTIYDGPKMEHMALEPLDAKTREAAKKAGPGPKRHQRMGLTTRIV